MISLSIARLIDALKYLPSVGPKSAQRMALHLLLEKEHQGAKQLITSLQNALDNIDFCSICRMLTDKKTCYICTDKKRNSAHLCIITNHSDLMAIESSGVYKGKYFVLQGHLSPIDGIGPEDIGVDLLLSRIATHEVDEIILATNSTLEGESTAYYISEKLKPLKIDISRLAQGIPLGGELEYLDNDTLAHALKMRKKF